MNKVLNRILQRYDLDKPILMQDKLDIIWDKHAPPINIKKKTSEDLRPESPDT